MLYQVIFLIISFLSKHVVPLALPICVSLKLGFTNLETWVYCSYDYKREYQLGLETTILVKNYTVSKSFWSPVTYNFPSIQEVEEFYFTVLCLACLVFKMPMCSSNHLSLIGLVISFQIALPEMLVSSIIAYN